MTDSLVDHSSQLTTLICIFLGCQVEFKEDDFDDFQKLLMGQLEVFVSYRHLEV